MVRSPTWTWLATNSAWLLEFIDPTVDIRASADGDTVSCSLMVAGVFPFGKFGRLGIIKGPAKGRTVST